MITKRLGSFLCAIVALYLLLSPAYALYYFEQFASDIPRVIRYSIIPGALSVIFLIVGFYTKPQIALVTGLSGVSALAGFFLFETVLTAQSIPVRLAMLGQLSNEQQEKLGRSDNTIRGFTLGGLNDAAGTGELSKALLSGFPGTRVVLCSSQDGAISYEADRYGFNNPDDIYQDPLELMVVGDSFVEGFCLPPGKDLTSRLRQEGLRAASFGLRGNGPLLELATIGRFGKIIRPRHVVFAFFEGNDWENLEKELGRPWLRAALEAEADYGSQEAAADTIRQAELTVKERSKKRITTYDLFAKTELLRNFVALQQTFTRLGLIYPKGVGAIPEFRTVLRQAKTIVAQWGGKVTMVYVPRNDRFLGVLSADHAFDALRNIVLDSAAKEGVDVVDLSEAFSRYPEPKRLYAPDNHFSQEGAAFAASIVARHLTMIEQSKAN
ncbi:SGNH/GDSL hydrolase family protein [Sinorhizobium numidicum]|uniref:SGNH/GDSL hydrolase family protein n=1 Tax=Sinorhizobium numidicum TaxID=680248 RepID=A0ABY8CSH3_9HYPH|nr:SGNH/GDSL hydrolase family protein [Sinorhizobium numidicum]WEX75593.1 SGNH/GDSL hydrolase family protein [Sinorhizobium numidicum]WEX81590.1 SGNH/GDSL hydrolase family protein [Sinorhizobium numidicum]